MTKFNFRERFLLRCAGVDLATMSECTSAEANKYMLIGACVLIPAVLAILTGGYTIFKISKSLYAAICFAPVWSWIIFTLDRAIVANSNIGQGKSSIFIRFILSIFISILISQPIELLAFSDVINQKRSIDLQTKKDKQTAAIDTLITTKEKKLERIKRVVDSLRIVSIREYTDGNPNAMHNGRIGRPGTYGPVAKRLADEVVKAEERAESEKGPITEEISLLKKDKANKLLEVTANDPTGIIGDLELLYAVAKENWVVRIASWVLTVFFIIMELVPIFIKLDSNSKSNNLYNDIKNKNDKACENANINVATKREQLLEAEQLLILSQRAKKIDITIKKNDIKEFTKDYAFFMQFIKATGDETDEIESSIVKRVKNEAVREYLLAQMLRLFYGFSQSLEELIKKYPK